MSKTAIKLKTVIFFGSARNVIPPWGGDSRLGDRVLKWVEETIKNRNVELGSHAVTHEVEVLDPLKIFGKDGEMSGFSTGLLDVPTFMVKELPPEVQALKQKIVDADCYLICSPEYNHIAPPALASLMGHFGGSCYAYKPSAICTYSPGPFAGMRAAMSIQVMAHELGCLPVSKLCGLPVVMDLLDENGVPKDPSARMLKQLPAMLDQLEWMAIAMKRQREDVANAAIKE